MTDDDGDLARLLDDAARRATAYAAGVDARPVVPGPAEVEALAAFDEPLPAAGTAAAETLALLDEIGSPATVASTGSRYFGFVTGGVHPAALAASWLAAAWDQNAALPVMSPVAAKLHEVTRAWLVDLLDLPRDAGLVYVTGATVANATCLAAARDALAARAGWDVAGRGLYGAPEVAVVVGEMGHSTLRKSLGLVGLGRERVHVVPSDEQGRLRADALPDLDGPVLVCAQAGEVNTGAFDPFEQIAAWAAERGAWLHVDAAFGLWARAEPSLAGLTSGLELADSLATDGHKWLNVGYDSGLAFVRRPEDLRRSFAASAGYLPAGEQFEPMHHTPQSSQRARAVEVWAVLRTLGRDGVAALVRRTCEVAALVAARLAAGGLEVLGDVVLNQVLVRAATPEATAALLAAVQADGRIWCGPTQWRGAPAIRISVSSWRTTPADGEVAATVVLEHAARVATIP